MLKPGLGKGLGDLMHEDQVAGREQKVPARPPKSISGRGMQSLVQPLPTPGAKNGPSSKTRPILPAWFFFTADLLLLAYTVAITFDAPRPFDLGTILFCAVSITLGALLAIFGTVQSAAPGAD